jgi:hypothetical protein
VPTDLQRLMTLASSLAERIRRERLVCEKQPKAGGGIKLLEQELAETWRAIRLARAPGTDWSVGDWHNSKWG